MPRFVILEHDHPTRHWDLMLEAGAVLRTWRLTTPPEPGREVEAIPSFDHRLLYLDYEGPVSGNRGTVRRWDAGTFEWETETPERAEFRLDGSRVAGPAILQRHGSTWSLTVLPGTGAEPPADGPSP
jgi:hypothetical protein